MPQDHGGEIAHAFLGLLGAPGAALLDARSVFTVLTTAVVHMYDLNTASAHEHGKLLSREYSPCYTL
jgi:hypothetical protein